MKKYLKLFMEQIVKIKSHHSHKTLHPNLAKIRTFFDANGIRLLTKRDSELKPIAESISADLLLQVYCAIYENIPHESKISKTSLIENYFDKVFGAENTFNQLLNAFRLHKYVRGENKKIASQHDFIAHGEYAILYTLVCFEPAQKGNINYETIQLSYEKSIELLDTRSRDIKDSGKTLHNYFKSKQSTDDINKAMHSFALATAGNG